MKKEAFKELFLNQLEIATEKAEERFKLSLPRNFKIRLSPRGTKQGNNLVDFDSALEALYSDDGLFPLYIDLAVEAVSINRHFTIVFAGAGKPDRVPFDLTWNYKSGSGPFKQQINEEISIVPE